LMPSCLNFHLCFHLHHHLHHLLRLASAVFSFTVSPPFLDLRSF
jgi:hypothetical protein